MAPQRVADAANISPYPFVVRQERQPSNAPDSSRPTKSKKKPKTRTERPRQDEEPRFNTGPRNFRATARKGFRIPGRSYADNGVPDYPPPSFQEAISTPALSVCSSTVSLVPPQVVPLAIAEPVQESISGSEDPIPEPPTVAATSSDRSDRRALVDPPNETTASDDTSLSDESMFVINKNDIPVCSTDLPRGPDLEEKVKKDWVRRRGVEFPKSPTGLVESPRASEDGHPRGRTGTRPPLVIDPDLANSTSKSDLSPISPKRRFLSLSPLKTMFPHRNGAGNERAMTAFPSPGPQTPYSGTSPYSGSRFFRSTTSLATASFLRLPTISHKPKSESLSRRLFSLKGKEKAKDIAEERWEVVDESLYAGVDENGDEQSGSLMAAVEAISSPSTANIANSPSRSMSFSYGADAMRSRKFYNNPSFSVIHANDTQAALSPSISQLSLLKDRSQGVPFIDRPLNRRSGQQSPVAENEVEPSTPVAEAPPMTLPSVASPSASRTQSAPASTPINIPVMDALPASPATPLAITHTLVAPIKHTALSPLSISPTNVTDAVDYLDTSLPMTPVYHAHYDRGIPPFMDHMKEHTPSPPTTTFRENVSNAGGVSPQIVIATPLANQTDAQSGCTCPVHPRPVPDTLRTTLNCIEGPSSTAHPAPSFTHSHLPSHSLRTSDTTIETPDLTTTPTTDESFVSSGSLRRHHYTGRPLPLPPMAMRQVDGASATKADHIPEGLLIDLEDTSLDSSSMGSGRSSPWLIERSNVSEPVYRPRRHSPLHPGAVHVATTDSPASSVLDLHRLRGVSKGSSDAHYSYATTASASSTHAEPVLSRTVPIRNATQPTRPLHFALQASTNPRHHQPHSHIPVQHPRPQNPGYTAFSEVDDLDSLADDYDHDQSSIQDDAESDEFIYPSRTLLQPSTSSHDFIPDQNQAQSSPRPQITWTSEAQKRLLLQQQESQPKPSIAPWPVPPSTFHHKFPHASVASPITTAPNAAYVPQSSYDVKGTQRSQRQQTAHWAY